MEKKPNGYRVIPSQSLRTIGGDSAYVQRMRQAVKPHSGDVARCVRCGVQFLPSYVGEQLCEMHR